MESHNTFFSMISDAALEFKKVTKHHKTVRLISHLDADGICAASIMVKALIRENLGYSISILSNLKEAAIEELSKEDHLVYIFTDLGSGQIENIKKYFKGKKIFIIDHHTPNTQEYDEDIVHVNPHLCGINGTHDISGAGVVFFFAKNIDERNKDMAHIAIVGAIGDIQEKNGFKPLNKLILEEALANNLINVTRSLRFFGAQTRPLYKVLAYSTDPYVPGVSGSESASIQFLNNLGINPKVSDKFKKFSNLTDDELKALTSAIIIKRAKEKDPYDILGNLYLLTKEEDESPTKDAREFSTMLNACGRLSKASVGIGVCIGDKNSKKEAIKVLNDYKKEIMSSLRWYEANKNSENIIKGEGYLIINAKEEVLDTMIGTLASILSHNENISDDTFILSLARSKDGVTKVSIRISGKNDQNHDLKKIIEEIILISGGESGGHSMAAGAIIPISLENDFIIAAKKVFEDKIKQIIV